MTHKSFASLRMTALRVDVILSVTKDLYICRRSVVYCLIRASGNLFRQHLRCLRVRARGSQYSYSLLPTAYSLTS